MACERRVHKPNNFRPESTRVNGSRKWKLLQGLRFREEKEVDTATAIPPFPH